MDFPLIFLLLYFPSIFLSINFFFSIYSSLVLSSLVVSWIFHLFFVSCIFRLYFSYFFFLQWQSQKYKFVFHSIFSFLFFFFPCTKVSFSTFRNSHVVLIFSPVSFSFQSSIFLNIQKIDFSTFKILIKL